MLNFGKTSLAFAVGLLLLFAACKSDPPTPPAEVVQPVSVPRFAQDSALLFVKKQVDFGPRVPNTEAHLRCKDWLASEFKRFGLSVTEQPFSAKAYTGKTLKGFNIIARHKPEAAKRILLAAHWDSRHIADSPLATERQQEPILGADDGGSGVAVLLEIARQLQAQPAELGVDFVLFDAEDHGDDSDANPRPESWCLGAQHWAKNLVPPGYRPKYGILLDMVGAAGAQFAKEGVSMNFAPEVMNKVWALAQGLGYTGQFVDTKAGPVTDDHYFVNTIAAIPMIDIIGKSPTTETGFGAHWHTHKDNLSVIDPRTLRSVGQTMLEVIYKEAAGKF